MKRHSALPYWLTVCVCEWFDDAGPRPVRARRRGRGHASQEPGHRVAVVNMTRLEVVHMYEFESLEVVLADPHVVTEKQDDIAPF